MALAQRTPGCDPLRDVITECAEAMTGLAEAFRRYIDAQEPRPSGQGSRAMRVVR